MTQVIHVDRRNLCFEGKILDVYADGFSDHGRKYNEPVLLSDSKAYTDALIEHFFELIRRTEFPNMPSRFTCWFGSDLDTPPEKQWYNREGFRDKNYRIWLLEAETTYKLDSRLLSIGAQDAAGRAVFDPDALYRNARCYWQGKTLPGVNAGASKYKSVDSSSPEWEILLVPPVRVIREIQRCEI